MPYFCHRFRVIYAASTFVRRTGGSPDVPDVGLVGEAGCTAIFHETVR
jgi:hypothetical protein